MSWRNAPSVAAGLSEATRRWPKRVRSHDGTIGDAAHAAVKSDHNPDTKGVVHAFDLTHDPAHGVDCEQLAAHIVTRKDPRVNYIIWNRRICNSKNWMWQKYTGKSAHDKHVHVSIKYTSQAENDTSAWWDLGPNAVAPPAPPTLPVPGGLAPAYPGMPLRQGSQGSNVQKVQQRLKERGSAIAVDGDFGPKTKQAVVAFQKEKRLVPDGVVGPKTWAALWGA